MVITGMKRVILFEPKDALYLYLQGLLSYILYFAVNVSCILTFAKLQSVSSILTQASMFGIFFICAVNTYTYQLKRLGPRSCLLGLITLCLSSKRIG